MQSIQVSVAQAAEKAEVESMPLLWTLTQKHPLREVALWFLAFVLVQCACAIPYVLVPVGVPGSNQTMLPYSEAVYHGWVTASTVGYGATPLPTAGWFRLYVCFHMLISTTLLGGLFGIISRMKGQQSAASRWDSVLNLKLTEEMICNLDRDGDGVDRVEFLITLLLQSKAYVLYKMRGDFVH